METLNDESMHRTERGSAGSTSRITPVDEVDPALPRSVPCTLRVFIKWKELKNGNCD